MNKHIRAAFFDIDGTLLFGSHEMPDSTVQALHALQANGVKVFIATGRPPVHLPHLPALQKVNWDGYVTMNGQYCFMADGEVIYSKYIDPAALRTLHHDYPEYHEADEQNIGYELEPPCRLNGLYLIILDYAVLILLIYKIAEILIEEGKAVHLIIYFFVAAFRRAVPDLHLKDIL